VDSEVTLLGEVLTFIKRLFWSEPIVVVMAYMVVWWLLAAREPRERMNVRSNSVRGFVDTERRKEGRKDGRKGRNEPTHRPHRQTVLPFFLLPPKFENYEVGLSVRQRGKCFANKSEKWESTRSTAKGEGRAASEPPSSKTQTPNSKLQTIDCDEDEHFAHNPTMFTVYI